MSEASGAEERVLVHAPKGRDGELTASILREEGFEALPCADVGALRTALEAGAGMVLVTQEGLDSEVVQLLGDTLERQPTWSDLPLVLLTGESWGGRRDVKELARRSAAAVLERPTRRETLVQAVRSGLRARARQYEVRDLLRRLEHVNERLERRVRERTVELARSNRRLAREVKEREEMVRSLQVLREEADAGRRRVTAILESISDAFMGLDAAERVTYANAHARELVRTHPGASQERLEGRALSEVLPALRTPEVAQALQRVRAGGQPQHLEVRLPQLGAWYQLNVYPAEEGLALYLRDVTERKRTEEELYAAVEAVMSDTAWFSRSLLEKLAQVRAGRRGNAPEGPDVSDLTPRERQVLERIARGQENARIAKELGLAEQTVRNYVSNILGKLGVRSRAEALVWARERGLTGA